MNPIDRVNPSTHVRNLVSRVRPTSPQEVTQLGMRLAALATGALFGLTQRSAAAGVLVAAVLLLPLEAARRWRVHRMTVLLYAYLRDHLRAEEHAGDLAQDRRVYLRALRGDWKALFTTANWEDTRARVRASRYVHLEIAGGGLLPTQDDVTRVRVHWAPNVEINKPGVRSAILDQVAAWYGDDCEVQGGLKKGFDTRRRYVWIAPKQDADLPTQVAYPGDTTPRFTQPLPDDQEGQG